MTLEFEEKGLVKTKYTNAFLPKKVVNFKATSKEKRKVIIAISGDSQDHIPFSISEMDLMSNTLHLTDCTTLNKKNSGNICRSLRQR